MIDLKATYGATYRITLDESAKATGQTREERLWLYRIPCRYGHIYVHGANTLGAYTDRRMVRGRLRALPGVIVHQDGDEETTVLFHPDQLPQIAELLQARRRRHLSPEARAIATARLAANRPNPTLRRSATAPDATPGGGSSETATPAANAS